MRTDYLYIRYYKVGRTKRSVISAFIRSISSKGADYILMFDSDESPCVPAKKREVVELIDGVDETKIVIVCNEIECWYLAGIPPSSYDRIGIGPIGRTDHLSDDYFRERTPERFRSEDDFMEEILKVYSVSDARARNDSFDHLVRHYL